MTTTTTTTQSTTTAVSLKELTYVLGEIFEAGSHTTSGALEVIVLACVSRPEAMRRLQAELDENVGQSRLPTFEDLSNLPYTRAFIEEVFRWQPLAPSGVPLAPSGVPHAPIQEDHYDGFRIPEGSAVVANHWSLDMDQDIFQDAQDFLPERWLDDSQLPLAAFGFGRRTCPGQTLARNSLLVVVSRLLWAFDIQWKEGQAQQLESLDFTHEGIFSKPCPFEAVFTVRSTVHAAVVRKGWEAGDGVEGDGEAILNAIGSAS